MEYIKGMEKALPDYSTRLARRSSTMSEEVLKGKLEAGKLTEAEALAAFKGEVA